VHTVRLIRSKGVSIVFVTQSPTDIPSDVLAQLGSRIQHALRAITPDDQRRLKDAVKTFPTTDLDLAEILTTLGTGEAVVTVLDPKGRPTPPAPFSIWAPASVMGEASDATISTLLSASDLVARYATPVDPRSATEELAERTQKAIDQRAAEEKQAELEKEQEKARKKAEREAEKERARWEKEAQREQQRAQKARERRQRSMESALANVIKSAGTQIGREITRSIFGTRRK
ncbi:MAG: helicase HerA-like domain-containing protein, partial [Actinomyces sp.]|nr:helicase HerA-like domain-containing protein [Actinomyces sp.]